MNEMSEIKPDRRLEKTRRGLGHAMFALLQTMDWDEITITELCKTADVARSSFYAHFENKADVLSHLITTQVPQQAGPQNGKPLAVLDWLINHVSENKTMFMKLNGSAGAAPVMQRFKQAIHARLKTDLAMHGTITSDEKLAFIIGGTHEALTFWARSWNAADLPKLKTFILAQATSVLLT